MHTMVDLRNRNYSVVIPRDCVASFDPEAHECALKHMEKGLGAKIVEEGRVTGLDVSAEFIEDTFQQEDDFVKVYNWPIDGGVIARRRDVALLVMYTNHLVYGTTEFLTDNITDSYDDLGLSHDRNLRSQLKGHVGIVSPEAGKYKINARGRKDAKKLMTDEEARRGG